ncbi:MAG: S8 family serine peptidase [Brasilonema octagenarum HA4186-MV1]|jgi:subtilisin family serine protease|uniref:Peptidase S8 and S53 subtilisin kexin sedolisin n=2 Tax=Brasilonema TaxID=383614 RepID=A0A856MFI7_9CYAN|nr:MULTISPECIES: S8 family serine peptidase [Brasilonema]MBW4626728.1 S8 family serine peptidase [Brasilonema octagenarum HA4186-MV1]NMF64262.1 peptidase S8 and S53 subtilisin kexin sedolisin [Brasilonema octagenarum UFV-OR1]QDL07726.1 peptidase S8 and S53 subtilisin kexin sedolisin [Brasilonema sennae CENA114]QDL14088.1 peptidase S8 and S53 subtilisin kexin sedolisin [Brasilonema octagenarum UFV-E1]
MANKQTWIIWGLGACCLSAPVLAAVESPFGTNGIDALRLHQLPYNLIGRKIAIGQVEIGRPGRFGLDKAVSKNRSVSIAGAFLRNELAKSNSGVDPHAYNVASMMVSTDKAFPGVAPGARLYSSAVGYGKSLGQPQECLSAQHVALQNGGDIRAINFSFGEPLNRDPRPQAVLDGNALLTLCIDWSSRIHNSLYIIAGNQGKGGIPIPTDNYNGLNVAFSSRRGGIYNKVDVSNLAAVDEGLVTRLAGKEMNLGPRRAIGIVAPGNNIGLRNADGKKNKVTGTSFAAPQVTATVALLQEFGDKQLRTKQPNWSIESRRHEVMKAVLLNSADKIQDSGDGLRLGMTRTLIDKQNKDWLATEAYKDPKIPLDSQMGTGHLNAFRAYQQFSAGEWNPTQSVPVLGWDYRTVNAEASVEYKLAKPLRQGSFVSITLTWDRLVELNDRNKNGQFDAGEYFRDRALNNLDLYLVKADDKNGNADAVCSSISEVDSVEHIFCPVPATGQYKIRVQFRKKVNEATQAYALAWWSVPVR